jgi:hypothetical protein
LYGILLGLALITWLANRGWRTLPLAPERRIIFGVVMLARG